MHIADGLTRRSASSRPGEWWIGNIRTLQVQMLHVASNRFVNP
jgi:hypothetical protein